MNSKKNISFSFFLFLAFLFFNCEDKFEYEKIKFDGSDLSVEILNGNFVIDSIVINNGIVNYYKTILVNKNKGFSKISLRKNNNFYVILNNNLNQLIENKKLNKENNEVIVYTRNINAKGTRKEMINNREIQIFNTKIIPSKNQEILIHAIKRR